MPEISRFFGTVIAMYYNDHEPPHFHARHGGFEVTVSIRDGVVSGRFPKRALRQVLDWQELHSDELMANWHRARIREPLQAIEPLED